MTHPNPAGDEPSQKPAVSQVTEQRPNLSGQSSGHSASHPSRGSHGVFSSNFVVILALLALGGFLLHILGVPIPGIHQENRIEEIPLKTEPSGVKLLKNADQSISLVVPDEVADALGIRRKGLEMVSDARVSTEKRPLVMSGSTALDPVRLWRVRIRFPSAQVIEFGKVKVVNPNSASPGTEETRELRPDDRVKKGDLLMVLHSVDVGQKKNDLIDSRVQLKLDQEILDRALTSAAVPEVFVLNARRNVETDRNSMVRAENTLRVWGIPDEDIKAAHDEADRIGREGWQNRNRDVGINSPWARVKMLAPEAGVIVERGVSLHETIVDNTINLMQIAQVDKLLVVANAFEEEINSVLKLPLPERKWAVRTINQSNQSLEPGNPPANGDQEALTGDIEDIGYLIDVNQRSAVLKGHIDNRGDKLRAGQYVTATILVPPPDQVVTIPIQAVVEDERGQTLVFVQKKDAPQRTYTLRRIQIVQRFNTMAYVSSKTLEQKPLTPEEISLGILPVTGLQVGDRLLTTGVLELKKELEDRMNEN